MSVHERIEEIVKGNNVVLFMKGSPLFPQCGFSSKAIAILDHLNVAYESVDVLQDMEIRAGIKDYSDWPTIPQLYVKGEFLGGSDIMMEMYDAGELQALVEAEGLAKQRPASKFQHGRPAEVPDKGANGDDAADLPRRNDVRRHAENVGRETLMREQGEADNERGDPFIWRLHGEWNGQDKQGVEKHRAFPRAVRCHSPTQQNWEQYPAGKRANSG